MNKEMIISSSDHETRVAILEDDQVVEVFIERERQRGVVGNVYKGRVSKVLPGMQSSFVDIGLERDGVPLRHRSRQHRRGVRAPRSGDEDDDEPAEPVRRRRRAAEWRGDAPAAAPPDGRQERRGRRARGAAAAATRRPRRASPGRRSKSCSRKGRRSSSRWSRSRSAPRARA